MARAKKRIAKRSKGETASNKVSAWQDDPMSKLPTLSRPVPKLSRPPLKYSFKGPSVAPAVYPVGTVQFRYWTAAEALRRGGDFWASLGVKAWQLGATLPVSLDKGVDLNAYYDRSELAFFHDSVSGKVVYSGESPDVVCHEMGHACLDAHRPELWDAPFVEVGAFHESWGDMSAILSALQLPTVRNAALAGLKQYQSSPLSRCAEQLGWAIRQSSPSSVDSDSLRDAYNSFSYVDPNTLPDDASAKKLSAEVHSFSRVFTGAFYEILCKMLKIRSGNPSDADVSGAALDLAQLLLDATTGAPVQPDYYAQVASHMIDADTARFAGKYRSALTSVFVARRIVPRSAVAPILAAGRTPIAVGARRAAAPFARPPAPTIHKVALRAEEFGLPAQKLIVPTPIEQRPFLSVAASIARRHIGPSAAESAAHRFVKMLFAHERVDVSSGKHRMLATKRTPRADLRKTHSLVKTAEGLKLRRRLFHCGCGRLRAL